MTDLRTAAQQALEALDAYSWEQVDEARTALKAALAEPVQEPVASIYITPEGEREFDDWRCDLPVGRTELYAAPPQRKPLAEPAERMHTDLDIPWRLGGWLVPKAERERRLQQVLQDFPKLRERDGRLAGQRKPLTEEEIYSLFRTVASPVMFARAIERAHGIT